MRAAVKEQKGRGINKPQHLFSTKKRKKESKKVYNNYCTYRSGKIKQTNKNVLLVSKQKMVLLTLAKVN
jgi:zona occludens toxin (predicted ATPase)